MSTEEMNYGPVEYRHDGQKYGVPWSLEFLTMAGFSRSGAKKVWAAWKAVEMDVPCFFIGLGTAATEMIEAAAKARDAHGPDDDYAAAWIDMGIDPDLLPQLLSDKHRPIRLLTSASSAFIASIDATETHWYDLHKKPRTNAAQSARPHVEVELPTSMEGHKMLYKADAVSNVEKIWVFSDSSPLRLDALSSKSPTDLHRKKSDMLYTFAQIEVAELSCSYQASFARHVPFGVLHIAMPNHLLTPDSGFLPITDMKHWRRLVLESRGKCRGPPRLWEISPDLEHYTDRTRFGVAAKICGQSTGLLEQLHNEMQVKPMVLKDGTEAMQYVFMDASYYDVRDECEAKVWLESGSWMKKARRCCRRVGRLGANRSRSDAQFSVLSYVATVATCFCSIATRSIGAIFTVATLYGFSSGAVVALSPVRGVTIIRRTPDPNLIGTRMGMAFALPSIGVLVGSPVCGAILNETGSFTNVWVFSGICLAVGTMCMVGCRLAQTGLIFCKNI